MITHVQLALLPADLQQVVLAKYRVALMEPGRKLSMEEAAWLYNYRYDYVRLLCASGKLRSSGSGIGRRISHAAMRAYRTRRKKKVPSKLERQLQQRIA